TLTFTWVKRARSASPSTRVLPFAVRLAMMACSIRSWAKGLEAGVAALIEKVLPRPSFFGAPCPFSSQALHENSTNPSMIGRMPQAGRLGATPLVRLGIDDPR